MTLPASPPSNAQIHIGDDQHRPLAYTDVTTELMKPQPVYQGEGGQGYAQYQSPRRAQHQVTSKVPTTRSQVQIPITHCPIRVISDIDDTVKDSGILNGARVVFHNVFVKDLRDCVVEGMGEWYTEMWKKGVRFHYVVRGSTWIRNSL